jgi:pyruvate/2-oxoglutarate dehydrogenase complex dihydrolipoamide acyltransferase (E2) component
MKKLMTTIGVGLMIALISPAVAQDKKDFKKMSVEERAQKITDRMTKNLDLSDDQAKDVYKINLEHVKKMEELRNQKKAQNEKTKAELDKVLTDEQKKKAEELRKKRQENRKNGHKPTHQED